MNRSRRATLVTATAATLALAAAAPPAHAAQPPHTVAALAAVAVHGAVAPPPGAGSWAAVDSRASVAAAAEAGAGLGAGAGVAVAEVGASGASGPGSVWSLGADLLGGLSGNTDSLSFEAATRPAASPAQPADQAPVLATDALAPGQALLVLLLLAVAAGLLRRTAPFNVSTTSRSTG